MRGGGWVGEVIVEVGLRSSWLVELLDASSIVVRVSGEGYFPDWEWGFAWDSLLGGIPPMFFKECASSLECLGCKSAGNKCVEVIEIVGDVRWGFSNWRSYFIEEYNVKIT